MLEGVTQVSTAPSFHKPYSLGALTPHAKTQALYNKWMCDRMLVHFAPPPLWPLYGSLNKLTPLSTGQYV